MQIGSVTASVLSTVPSSDSQQSQMQNYADIIAQFYQASPYQTRDELNASDTELAKFKTDLTSKGAAQFLKDLNQEKIDALVEEYRQKLLKDQEKNPDQPMDINQMVSDFKKELLKEIEEARKAEQEASPDQKTSLSTAEVMTAVKSAKNSESTLQNPIGFLEQMLNPNVDLTKTKENWLL